MHRHEHQALLDQARAQVHSTDGQRDRRRRQPLRGQLCGRHKQSWVQAGALATGDEQWRAARPKFSIPFRPVLERCTLLYHDQILFFAQPNPEAKNLDYSEYTVKGIRMLVRAHAADTGKVLWERSGNGWGVWESPDLFVIKDHLWIHDFGSFSLMELDTKTGKELRRLDTTSGLKREHHHRCWRNRSTEDFVMTSRRGIELYNSSDGTISINDWTRTTCNLGYFPCNGLLYMPPHACRCYVDQQLNGFLALSSRPDPSIERELPPPVLVKGSAYGKPVAPAPAASEWPMWRHDGERSGYTTAKISALKLQSLWTASVPGEPTGAVVAGNKVFVGSKKGATLHALDMMTGKEVWTHFTDGPMDVPPSVFQGLVLLSGRDGWLDCVRSDDGSLVYRLRGAPGERQILAHGRLESSWPSYGVLIHNNLAYFTAGRSPHLDGGIFAFGVNPSTGEIKERKRLQNMAALADALVAAGDSVSMKGATLFGAGATNALFSEDSLINPQWSNPVEWLYGKQAIGQNAVMGPDTIYCAGVRELFTPGRAVSFGMEVHRFTPGKDGYYLNALNRNKVKTIIWKQMVKVKPIAMAGTPDVLLIAGTPDIIPENDPLGALEGRKGGVLLAVSTKDGKTLAEYPLAAPPAFDGITIVDGCVFVCLVNGELRCYQAEKNE